MFLGQLDKKKKKKRVDLVHRFISVTVSSTIVRQTPFSNAWVAAARVISNAKGVENEGSQRKDSKRLVSQPRLGESIRLQECPRYLFIHWNKNGPVRPRVD